MLTKSLHIGSFQTRSSPAIEESDPCAEMDDVVRTLLTLSEKPMTDSNVTIYKDELWIGKQSFSLSVTNWSGQPVMI